MPTPAAGITMRDVASGDEVSFDLGKGSVILGRGKEPDWFAKPTPSAWVELRAVAGGVEAIRLRGALRRRVGGRVEEVSTRFLLLAGQALLSPDGRELEVLDLWVSAEAAATYDETTPRPVLEASVEREVPRLRLVRRGSDAEVLVVLADNAARITIALHDAGGEAHWEKVYTPLYYGHDQKGKRDAWDAAIADVNGRADSLFPKDMERRDRKLVGHGHGQGRYRLAPIDHWVELGGSEAGPSRRGAEEAAPGGTDRRRS